MKVIRYTRNATWYYILGIALVFIIGCQREEVVTKYELIRKEGKIFKKKGLSGDKGFWVEVVIGDPKADDAKIMTFDFDDRSLFEEIDTTSNEYVIFVLRRETKNVYRNTDVDGIKELVRSYVKSYTLLRVETKTDAKVESHDETLPSDDRMWNGWQRERAVTEGR